MARPKKMFQIQTMKVPTVFRDRIVKESKALGMEPTNYLYEQEMKGNAG